MANVAPDPGDTRVAGGLEPCPMTYPAQVELHADGHITPFALRA